MERSAGLILTVAAFGSAACAPEPPAPADPAEASAPSEPDSATPPQPSEPGAVAGARGAQDPVAIGDENAFGALTRLRGMPREAPVRPAQHYRMSGTIEFRIPEREPVTQDCTVSLGGADRLRYTLASDSGKLMVLLHGDRAWQRNPGVVEYEEFDAESWQASTWLRWSAARFPWDFEAATEGPPLERYRLEGPFASFELELDRDGRPGAWVSKQARLELSEYEPLPSGVQFPRTWTWIEGGITRIERFTDVVDGALLLDAAFRPRGVEAPEESWGTLLVRPGAERRAVSDAIGVTRRPAAPALLGPAEPDWTPFLTNLEAVDPRPWFELRDGSVVRRALLLTGDWPPVLPRELPEGVELGEIPGGEYLRWTTFRRRPAADAESWLREAARGNRLGADGPLWAQQVGAADVPVPQEILLRVGD